MSNQMQNAPDEQTSAQEEDEREYKLDCWTFGLKQRSPLYKEMIQDWAHRIILEHPELAQIKMDLEVLLDNNVGEARPPSRELKMGVVQRYCRYNSAYPHIKQVMRYEDLLTTVLLEGEPDAERIRRFLGHDQCTPSVPQQSLEQLMASDGSEDGRVRHPVARMVNRGIDSYQEYLHTINAAHPLAKDFIKKTWEPLEPMLQESILSQEFMQWISETHGSYREMIPGAGPSSRDETTQMTPAATAPRASPVPTTSSTPVQTTSPVPMTSPVLTPTTPPAPRTSSVPAQTRSPVPAPTTSSVPAPTGTPGASAAAPVQGVLSIPRPTSLGAVRCSSPAPVLTSYSSPDLSPVSSPSLSASPPPTLTPILAQASTPAPNVEPPRKKRKVTNVPRYVDEEEDEENEEDGKEDKEKDKDEAKEKVGEEDNSKCAADKHCLWADWKEASDIEWVMCGECEKWFHSFCVLLDNKAYKREDVFTCCGPNQTKDAHLCVSGFIHQIYDSTSGPRFHPSRRLAAPLLDQLQNVVSFNPVFNFGPSTHVPSNAASSSSSSSASQK
ncbi:hypothetical protein CAEBREN_03902 [Caenorhabditis brenneri]|uniref:Zinc finger PHD-type domain-containing protein n=1 Tax=Caenorhabditis brenneri TaxID=135651 RepID=G0MW62_CAEBE|nr:hypothetical protein CAEBREN_03902 [Caenorhabditis brenneri]